MSSALSHATTVRASDARSAAEDDAEAGHPAQGDVRLVGGLSGEARLRKSPGHRRQRDGSLESGQRCAETEVRPEAEREVTNRRTVGVEFVGAFVK